MSNLHTLFQKYGTQSEENGQPDKTLDKKEQKSNDPDALEPQFEPIHIPPFF